MVIHALAHSVRQHADRVVVEQVTQFVESLGHHYLQDVRGLRSGEIWDERLCDFIREADVFQLFWSTKALESQFVEREWRYAISLGRPNFIRPTYWEQPMPKAAGLPPPELGKIHFYPLGKAVAVAQKSAATGASAPEAPVAEVPVRKERSSTRGELSTPWPDLPPRGGWHEAASAPPPGPVNAPPPVFDAGPSSMASPEAHPASRSRRRPLVWAGAAAGLLLAAPLVAVVVLASGGHPKPASPPPTYAPSSAPSSEPMTPSSTPPTTTRLTTSTTVAPTLPMPSGVQPTPMSPAP